MANEYRELEESINTTINVNALLILLNRKGIVDKTEFEQAKKEALEELKAEFPKLFI